VKRTYTTNLVIHQSLLAAENAKIEKMEERSLVVPSGEFLDRFYIW